VSSAARSANATRQVTPTAQREQDDRAGDEQDERGGQAQTCVVFGFHGPEA
jgi:hypothetical protein